MSIYSTVVSYSCCGFQHVRNAINFLMYGTFQTLYPFHQISLVLAPWKISIKYPILSLWDLYIVNPSVCIAFSLLYFLI